MIAQILNFVYRKNLIILILLGLLTYNTNIYANGQQIEITIKGKHLSLSEIFSEIQYQIGYKVNTENLKIPLAKNFTVYFEKTDVNKVLRSIIKEKINIIIDPINKTINIHPSPSTNNFLDSIPSKAIEGLVKDNQGNVIPGVTIKIKNTNHGTTTDNSGRFLISNIKKGDKLVFSSIGYETKEYKTDNKTIVAELNPFINNLNETQVIAYGTRSKRLNTGNVGTIKAQEIQDLPLTNPLLTIQGRIPGVDVTPANGLPGAGVTIRIQGANSLQSGNDPLIVIDNVPYPSQNVSTGGNISTAISGVLGNSGGTDYGQIGSPLSYINTSDIESIDVLKGADATSIYGSRAANGAILITTKKGKKGKMSVDVDFQSGIKHTGKRLAVLSAHEYLDARREAIRNDGRNIGRLDFDLNGRLDTSISHDWQKELMSGNGSNTIASVGLSGGNDHSNYLIRGTYYRENYAYQQAFNSTYNERASFHTSLSASSPNNRLSMTFVASYMHDYNKLPLVDYFSIATRLMPIGAELITSDGKINWQPNPAGLETFDNPLANSVRLNENKTNSLVSNLNLYYEIIPGLRLTGNFGVTNIGMSGLGTLPMDAIAPSKRSITQSSLTQQSSNQFTWNLEPMLTYKVALKKGEIDALVGTTILKHSDNFSRLIGSGFSSDLLIKDIGSANRIGNAVTAQSAYRYAAFFGRVNYNYNSKYLFQITGRRDGSSRFGSENRFHAFGSVAAAWIFSEESFFKEKLPWLYFGKLRSSYGTTGNDQINNYQYLTLYSSNYVTRPYQGIIGLQPNGLTNPLLQWEEVRKLEIGLETGFIDNRISLNANFALNRSTNQLMGFAISTVSGFNNVTVNLPAKVQNKFWEFTLNTINIQRPQFTWSSTITLTIPNTKLISFDGVEKTAYANRFMIGKSLTANRVYRSAGVNDTTGIFQFYDSKGNTTYYPDPINDATLIKTLDPKYNGGFSNRFTYKSLTLNLFFTYSRGYNTIPYNGIPPGTYNYNIPTYFLDRWQKPGDHATFQKFTSTYQNLEQYSYFLNSDKVYIDQYLIRLREVSLYWNLPKKWQNAMRMVNGSVYAQILNPFFVTNNKKVLDPQTGFSLPLLQTYNLGIKATF